MMTRIFFFVVLVLLASCKREYQCTCRMNGTFTYYELRKMSYSDAVSKCDSYVQGDTCEIPQKK